MSLDLQYATAPGIPRRNRDITCHTTTTVLLLVPLATLALAQRVGTQPAGLDHPVNNSKWVSICLDHIQSIDSRIAKDTATAENVL